MFFHPYDCNSSVFNLPSELYHCLELFDTNNYLDNSRITRMMLKTLIWRFSTSKKFFLHYRCEKNNERNNNNSPTQICSFLSLGKLYNDTNPIFIQKKPLIRVACYDSELRCSSFCFLISVINFTISAFASG